MRTIRIVVDPDGRARVETVGFDGPGCREASRFVERALGARVAEAVTPEFYRPPQQLPQGLDEPLRPSG